MFTIPKKWIRCSFFNFKIAGNFTTTNILKKLYNIKQAQLLRNFRSGVFDLAPEVENLAVLFVGYSEYAGMPRRRHGAPYPAYVYR